MGAVTYISEMKMYLKFYLTKLKLRVYLTALNI